MKSQSVLLFLVSVPTALILQGQPVVMQPSQPYSVSKFQARSSYGTKWSDVNAAGAYLGVELRDGLSFTLKKLPFAVKNSLHTTSSICQNVL